MFIEVSIFEIVLILFSLIALIMIILNDTKKIKEAKKTVVECKQEINKMVNRIENDKEELNNTIDKLEKILAKGKNV